jgi:hypothetical protein
MPTTVTIDWDDVPDTELYVLQIGPGCDLGTAIPTGTTSQYTVSGLLPGQTYFVRVQCTNYCGRKSRWSYCKHFTTEYVPSPYFTFTEPPEGDYCQDPDSVTVRWDPMPRADLYQIQLGEACGSGAVHNVNPPLTEITFSGLNDSTTYYYRTKTLDECGNWSEWSDCGTFTTLPVIYPVPQQAYPPDGYACVGTSPVLTWTLVGHPATYEVEWGESCRMDTTAIVNGNYIILPQLAEGTWYWHVRARHVCGGVSSWSPCYSFDVDGTAPVWPEWLESTTHEVATWSNEPVVSTYWQDATDDCNVEYRVVWDHLPSTEPDSLAQTIPDTMHDSEPLPDGDDHWVHVWAKDVPGNMAANPQHLGPFWIDTSGPTVTVIYPVGGQHLVEGSLVTIAWTADDPLSGVDDAVLHYTIDAAATWEPIAVITDPLVTTHDWIVPSALTDSARVRITAIDELGNSGNATNERWFSIGPPTGVDDSSAPARFALADAAPNPFNPSTTVRFAVPTPTRVRLAVFDLQGRYVRTLRDGAVEGPGWHEARWFGQDDAGRQVAAGVYFYRLTAGGYSETRRMVLVK